MLLSDEKISGPEFVLISSHSRLYDTFDCKKILFVLPLPIMQSPNVRTDLLLRADEIQNERRSEIRVAFDIKPRTLESSHPSLFAPQYSIQALPKRIQDGKNQIESI